MDSSLAAYLPQDRRLALAQGEPLREHTHGAIASARAILGDEVFAADWDRGKQLTLDEAIAYALASDQLPTPPGHPHAQDR